jgi:hypothetical protein
MPKSNHLLGSSLHIGIVGTRDRQRDAIISSQLCVGLVGVSALRLVLAWRCRV